MEFKNQTKTGQILTIMHILTWVVFIGLLIETGAILFSYGASYINPEAANDLYGNVNLYNLRQYDFYYYSALVSFMVVVSGMKAYLSYLVIKILARVNLQNPFIMEVAKKIETISHVLLGIWIVSILYNVQGSWLSKRTDEYIETWNAGAFLFMAGLVFIISQIFKRGVEIQAENELIV